MFRLLSTCTVPLESFWKYIGCSLLAGIYNIAVAPSLVVPCIHNLRRTTHLCDSYTICWQLWLARNAYIYNQRKLQPSYLISKVISLSAALFSLLISLSTAKTFVQQGSALQQLRLFPSLHLLRTLSAWQTAISWKKPITIVKLNADGSLRGTPNQYSIGGIIRDTAG
ncbi:hypothetical protein ACH5RR_006986 [Cinchona calisaya]|uniref:Uncharacterized protein n=1 Tax=Cinchona calisaya TaxID=153742 RepID=A0ABD3AQM9_9GENT